MGPNTEARSLVPSSDVWYRPNRPKAVPKKKGCKLGIGSVNDVTKAISSYGQRWDDETAQLRSELNATRSDLGITQAHLGSLVSFLDVLVARNLQLESMLQQRREQFSIPQPHHAPEDEEDLERRSQDFFQEVQKNP
ncbi:unnamed protein product [Brassica rapa]|uniref:Uncharacterized protein n=1 Tax=Brassica campestris TaxID=3711 RepID=A0A3P6C399_BRACM|nr:unnamed protein product [Brassica rapa]VDD02972.1 unnamed protein product [Brassica rapa]